MENKETTDKIPTVSEFLKQNLVVGMADLIEPLFLKFTQLHLTKQAEVIAEKAYGLHYEDAFDKNPTFVDCEPKSILQASEEYKQSVK